MKVRNKAKYVKLKWFTNLNVLNKILYCFLYSTLNLFRYWKLLQLDTVIIKVWCVIYLILSVLEVLLSCLRWLFWTRLMMPWRWRTSWIKHITPWTIQNMWLKTNLHHSLVHFLLVFFCAWNLLLPCDWY